MSFTTCLKSGTAAGLVAGLIASAFFKGSSKLADKSNNPATFALEIFSLASLVGGPIMGAGAGASYYGINKGWKYLRAAPRSTQLAVVTILGLGTAISGAHTIAAKDKSN